MDVGVIVWVGSGVNVGAGLTVFIVNDDGEGIAGLQPNNIIANKKIDAEIFPIVPSS